MVGDEEVIHSLSRRCTWTFETRTPNTTPTSTERPSNVRSRRWFESSRDSSVLYRDTVGICLNIYICL